MDVPHRAAGGRLRRRQLGQRVVALLGQHERLVDAHGRRRDRLRLPADRHADRRLLRRPPAGGQPVRREPGRTRHRDRPADVALPGGAPRRLGLRLPGRSQPHRYHRRRPSHQGDRPGEQAGLHLRLRPRHRRAGLADRGTAGRDRHRPRRRRAVADPALPDEAAGVRVPGRHHRRPGRLHARRSGRWRSRQCRISGSGRSSRRPC